MSHRTGVNLLAGIACGLVGLGAALPAQAGVCPNGVHYQTVEYFKPPAHDYPQYVDQGGFHLSLCNAAHGTPGPNAVCNNINLKGYLYLPGPVPAAARVPLILWVDGSFANPTDAGVPNPTPYPTGCPVGSWFARRGFAVLAVVRRGYKPSTGENEMVRQAHFSGTASERLADVLNYLANESFETQLAVQYMLARKTTDGRRSLINPNKVAVIGHSLGGLVGLYFGTTGNPQPLIDAGIPSGRTRVKAKALIAPASQSWDAFDLEDGVYDDTSPSIERLKLAAQHSLLPSYFIEPLNDQSFRPAVVLGKAAGDFQLAENQSCRLAIAPPGSAPSDTQIRQEVDTCPLPREFQTALFPVQDISADPTASSAHGQFAISPDVWGPSVLDFFARHGVKP